MLRYQSIKWTAGLMIVWSLVGCGGGGSGSDTTSSANKQSVSMEQSGVTTPSNSKAKIAQLNENADSSSSNNSQNESNQIATKPNLSYELLAKVVHQGDQNITTLYSSSHGSTFYQIDVNSTSTDGTTTDKQYDYNNTSKTLNVYVKNPIGEMELTQRTTFADGWRDLGASIKDGNNTYAYTTFGAISYLYDVHPVKKIKDIEKGLNTTYIYHCNKQNKLSAIEQGYVDTLDGKFIQEKANILSDKKPVFEINGTNVIEKVGGKVVAEYRFRTLDN